MLERLKPTDMKTTETSNSGFMQVILFLGMCFGFVFPLNGQSNLHTWTGSTSADWHTAANWNPAEIPGAEDTAWISASSNQPVISSADVVLKHLQISSSTSLTLASGVKLTINNAVGPGVVCYGTLTNNGTIEVQKTGSNGIEIMSSGNFNNYGTLQIGVIGGGRPAGVGLKISGAGLNANGASISVQNVNIMGLHIDGSGGSGEFVNNGDIAIATESGSFISSTGTGLNVASEAEFTNNGTISINKGGGLSNNTHSLFVNSGSINIGTLSGADIRRSALYNSVSTFTNEGNIYIQYSTDPALYNYGEQFTNNGYIGIGTAAGATVKEEGIYSAQGGFTNNSSGSIYIQKSIKSALYHHLGNFSNSGSIVISGSIGVYGIWNSASEFTNSGSIGINNVSSNGIHNASVQSTQNTKFYNSGGLDIGGAIGGHGIYNAKEFYNQAGGNIIISGVGTGKNGIENAAGATFVDAGSFLPCISCPFSNAGLIKGTGTYNGNLFNNSGTIAPGSSPGVITFTNNYVHSSGIFQMEADGKNGAGLSGGHDQVLVGGTATLGGSLNLTVNYSPTAGDVLVVVHAGALAKDGSNQTIPFSSVTLPTNWFVNYNLPNSGDVSVSYAAPLPLEWISLEAEYKHGLVWLAWETANERGNAGFVIEKAFQLPLFDSIAWVNAVNTDVPVRTYTFADPHILDGRWYYYRIKQVDFDGSYAYSKILSVRSEKTQGIQVYPNPSDGAFRIVHLSPSQTSGQIEVFDMTGKRVFFREQSFKAAYTDMEIDLPERQSGTYILRITTPSGIVVHKVVVR